MTFRHFARSLGCLFSPALDELATQLSLVEGLSARERDVIADATRESLYTVLHSKVSRLLVLELNAARVTGRLSGENSGINHIADTLPAANSPLTVTLSCPRPLPL